MATGDGLVSAEDGMIAGADGVRSSSSSITSITLSEASRRLTRLAPISIRPGVDASSPVAAPRGGHTSEGGLLGAARQIQRRSHIRGTVAGGERTAQEAAGGLGRRSQEP
eukprot:3815684-Prymnesium_polylepis.1